MSFTIKLLKIDRIEIILKSKKVIKEKSYDIF